MEKIIEEWRPVKGFEGLYEVSNLGKVRSLDKVGSKGVFNIKSVLRVGSSYYELQLRKNNKLFTPRLHAVVANAFCEKPISDNRLCVDHIDCNKKNNKASNLEWVTYKENARRASLNGLLKVSIGEDSHKSILSKDQVSEIITCYNNGEKMKDLRIRFNVSKMCIYGILSRKNWNKVDLPKITKKTNYFKNIDPEIIGKIRTLLSLNTPKLKIQELTGICRKSSIYKHLQ